MRRSLRSLLTFEPNASRICQTHPEQQSGPTSRHLWSGTGRRSSSTYWTSTPTSIRSSPRSSRIGRCPSLVFNDPSWLPSLDHCSTRWRPQLTVGATERVASARSSPASKPRCANWLRRLAPVAQSSRMATRPPGRSSRSASPWWQTSRWRTRNDLPMSSGCRWPPGSARLRLRTLWQSASRWACRSSRHRSGRSFAAVRECVHAAAPSAIVSTATLFTIAVITCCLLSMAGA
mmetsp:Transcript_68297/g.148666  ORF Transcript_68297/g.148666 Transcript_68297/m.148666 type:complete len:233 (-) Transcript_68297:477-1175(-)